VLIVWGALLVYWAATANLCDQTYGCPHGHLGMWWRIMLAASGALLGLSGLTRLMNNRPSRNGESAVKVARALLIVSAAAFVVWIDLHHQVTNQTGP
jgi:hypothetical protein